MTNDEFKPLNVQDISLHPVSNTGECEALMAKGWNNRATGATKMNADSSRSLSVVTGNSSHDSQYSRTKDRFDQCLSNVRSHSIFTINIEMMDSGGEGHIRKVICKT